MPLAKQQRFVPMNTLSDLKFSMKPRGLTLIELMVALAISLIVLFAVSNVFLSTRQNVRLQAGVSRANEAAQFSTDILARDIRQIAYVGCPTIEKTTISRDSLNAGGVTNTIDFKSASVTKIKSAGDADTPADAYPGSAIIEVLHGAEGGVHVATATPERTDPLTLTGDPGFRTKGTAEPEKEIAIVSSCKDGEIFQIARVLQGPWRVDPQDPLRARYGTDARVMPATRTQYYVAEAKRAADERTTRAIYVRRATKTGVGWSPGQPLVHDVENMTVSALLDTDKDFAADQTVAFGAVGDPSLIVGYRLALVFNAPKGSLLVPGGDATPIQRSVQTSINIRARVI